MRAAGAEIGNAVGHVRGGGQHALGLLQFGHAGGDVRNIAIAQQALAQLDGDVIGVQRALHREQPAALFILLADAHRLVGGAVQLLAHLNLDERAFFLHHHDQVEALGKFIEALGLDRPRAGQFPDPQAQIIGPHLVDAQFVEGEAHVQIALAHGGDADARALAAGGDEFVEAVGAQEMQHRVALIFPLRCYS